MNGKRFGGQQFVVPAERARPGRSSAPLRTGGRMSRRVPFRSPRFFGKSQCVRPPSPRPSPPGEGESLAVSTGDNAGNWFVGAIRAHPFFLRILILINTNIKQANPIRL